MEDSLISFQGSMSQTRTRLAKKVVRLGSARTRLLLARYITNRKLKILTRINKQISTTNVY